MKFINLQVVVISALGEYHSGKSFLLNQIMREQEGFVLGPTVAPETKVVHKSFINCNFINYQQGIWARVTYVEDTAIIFLDTEGFFGQGASENYDGMLNHSPILEFSYANYNIY